LDRLSVSLPAAPAPAPAPHDYRIDERTRAFLNERHALLIGGRWVEPREQRRIDVIDPATERRIASVAAAGAADVDAAVTAARSAFVHGDWPAMSGGARAKLIWALADRMVADARVLAELETLDNGKPLKDTLAIDIPVGAELLRYMGGWATKLQGESVQIGDPGDFQSFTLREPVGVVGQIIPWNFPLLMALLKVAPALAAGCTLILKPAEQTPLTALRLGALATELGFPPGVINILTGYGETAGAALSLHPGVDKIAFTGSTEVGRRIVAAAAGNLKRVSLELGGKSPMIVMPDADVDAVIAGVVPGIFFNAGQSCMAGSRLLVHESLAARVTEAVAARARAIRVGSGFDSETEIGPLISQSQLARVQDYVRSGLDEGARLITGAEQTGREGYFLSPGVFTDVHPGMRIAREEIFGPVLCISSFKDTDLDHVASLANDTPYGLAASIWTQDIGTAHGLTRKLRSGQVWINAHHVGGPDMPIGGYKQSGWGRELGRAGVELYTELKAVAIALKKPGDWLQLKG
jgi:phenylacetaldehyde dehydrogenase